jgi:hypothetical protein
MLEGRGKTIRLTDNSICGNNLLEVHTYVGAAPSNAISFTMAGM